MSYWGFAYAIAVGFVAAGLTSSAYQLITRKPVAFELLFQRSPTAFLSVFVLIFAAPALIMRNAIRGRMIENRPGHWLALSTALSAGWSFLQGIFILSFILAFSRHGLV